MDYRDNRQRWAESHQVVHFYAGQWCTFTPALTLRDQRTKSAYIFGAICPARGVGAGLVLPRCNTQAMQWHLDEISALVTPGAHAVLIIDRAGWHTTGRLEIPSNITLMFLPPRAPELNPVENIWHFMRDNWLSNRIFKPAFPKYRRYSVRREGDSAIRIMKL